MKLEETDFAMDARSNIKGRLPSCHPTAGSSRAPANAALQVVQIRKNTQNAAELKPAGRYLAKDIREVGGISLLMKTLLVTGHPYGDCIAAPGRPIAENLKSAKSNPHVDVRFAPNGAGVKVLGMSSLKLAMPSCFAQAAVGGEAGLLQDGDILEIDADATILNGNLTGIGLAEHQTKQQLEETNQRLGARWKYAQQIGPAVGGAVTHPGGAHEKQCYAEI
jgi:dihydroxyacid dehydratase/phosphogluconate dehydratase